MSGQRRFKPIWFMLGIGLTALGISMLWWAMPEETVGWEPVNDELEQALNQMEQQLEDLLVGAAAPEFPLDLNLANEKELQHLPGIGPSKASAIVEYRKLHGPFADKREVTKVKGIGEATFEDIKDKIHVSSDESVESTENTSNP